MLFYLYFSFIYWALTVEDIPENMHDFLLYISEICILKPNVPQQSPSKQESRLPEVTGQFSWINLNVSRQLNDISLSFRTEGPNLMNKKPSRQQTHFILLPLEQSNLIQMYLTKIGCYKCYGEL